MTKSKLSPAQNIILTVLWVVAIAISIALIAGADGTLYAGLIVGLIMPYIAAFALSFAIIRRSQNVTAKAPAKPVPLTLGQKIFLALCLVGGLAWGATTARYLYPKFTPGTIWNVPFEYLIAMLALGLACAAMLFGIGRVFIFYTNPIAGEAISPTPISDAITRTFLRAVAGAWLGTLVILAILAFDFRTLDGMFANIFAVPLVLGGLIGGAIGAAVEWRGRMIGIPFAGLGGAMLGAAVGVVCSIAFGKQAGTLPNAPLITQAWELFSTSLIFFGLFAALIFIVAYAISEGGAFIEGKPQEPVS